MDKKALEEKFEGFARWYVLPLDKSEDGTYRALETQSAWMSFQHQQAKVDELQRKIDAVKDLMEMLEQDDSVFLIYEELEKALKGEG
ncbi:hypothetical protein [Acinetobacter phage vB_AbaM_BP10]|nr:hypothetical protein [Acinetobacter phage vB_AbaM_BP10]